VLLSVVKVIFILLIILYSEMKRVILAFDLFGTILDTSNVMQEFREKQLEYTWLLTLTGRFMEFEEITKRALSYVLKIKGEENKFDEELAKWNNLKAYPDAMYLKEISKGAEIYILSNGSEREVKQHLSRNGLLEYFKGMFSTELVRAYKPSPLVYIRFLDFVGAKQEDEVYLVSSNPFDVIGAKNAGLGGIYVNRRGVPVYSFGIEPDVNVKDFKELYEWLISKKR